MSASAAQQQGSLRLLWLLVGVLLLLGVLNIVLASLLPGMIHRWLGERGLEARIEHLDLSLPRLQAGLRGVEVRNQAGRGFSAREASLGLSWWYLLQGKIHLKQVALDGVQFDLESLPGKRGRIWEIGGWLLGEGEKKDRNWRVDLDRATLRDAIVCYQHKPQWRSASCAQIAELELEDFYVAARRQGAESLALSLALEQGTLHNLLAWDEHPDNAGPPSERGEGDMRKSARESPTMVVSKLELSAGLFQRPANRITAERIFARKFAGCPPARWAEVVAGLGRLVGHCASARRLDLRGPLEFTFGKRAAVVWRRASGQEIRVRYANRSLPNWQAETIAVNSFSYLRADKTLNWQSAGSSGFSWCPPPWRTDEHHYCLRAGSLRLPRPTAMGWANRFRFDTRGAVLAQGSLLDVGTPRPGQLPLSLNELRVERLGYAGAERRLTLDGLHLDGAAGCVPGQLWQSPDQCLQLARLAAPEQLAVHLRDRAGGRGWGLSSGPLRLDRVQLASDVVGGERLELRGLHWTRAALGSADTAQLLQDFALEQLTGCLPRPLLPTAVAQQGALCAQIAGLRGVGSFVAQSDPQLNLILGQLQLNTLQLTDQQLAASAPGSGVRLSRLQLGDGLVRRQHRRLAPGQAPFDMPYLQEALTEAEPLPDPEQAGDTLEKGRLPDTLLRQERGEQPDRHSAGAGQTAEFPAWLAGATTENISEAELQRFSLARVEGCLPGSWVQLLYQDGGAEGKPVCFDIDALRQQQPLHFALVEQRLTPLESSSPEPDLPAGTGPVRQRLYFDAADISLQRAQVTDGNDKALVTISGVRVPQAQLALASLAARVHLRLPQLQLEQAHFCVSPVRCVDAAQLATGEIFRLDFNRAQFAADLNKLALQKLDLSGPPQAFTAQVRALSSLQLQASLPRQPGAHAAWQMRKLRAELVEFCLPRAGDDTAGIPRCATLTQLGSEGEGLEVAQLQIGAALGGGDRPELSAEIDRVSISELGLRQGRGGALQWNLRDLAVGSLRACGLEQWLQARGAADTHRLWAGCLQSDGFQLSGDNLIAMGRRTDLEPLLYLGAADFARIALVNRIDGPAQASLAHLQWRELRWPGGMALQLADLQAREFSGCLPPLAGSTGADPLCAKLSLLALPDDQRLQFAGDWQISGHLQLAGLDITQGGRQRLAVAQLGVEQLRLDGGALVVQAGEVSGASGCLPEVRVGERTLAPCLDVGHLRVESEHQLQLARAAGAPRQLHNVRIDGLRLRDPGFPTGLPAPLLLVEHMQADTIRFDRQQVLADKLQLKNWSSCLPAGYLPDVDHCLHVDTLTASGGYQLLQRALTLAYLELADTTVRRNNGRDLLQSQRMRAEQVWLADKKIQVGEFRAADSKIFHRAESAREYSERQWNTELDQLHVSDFVLDRAGRQLDIAAITLVRPYGMLARSRSGDYGAWEFLLDDDVEPLRETAVPRARRNNPGADPNRFRYRIGEVLVDEGRFLWLDDYHALAGRLPISGINVLLRGASSHIADPPAVLLVNAHPGRLGELQLAGSLDLKSNGRWDGDLLGYVVAANLIPATPYMAHLLGYKILQGQLDAELNMQVEDNQLDALADMVLEKIKVRRVRESDHLEVEKTLIPLSLALALLKDGSGDVDIKMPVTGDLFDPKFSLGYVFGDLLQRAILESLFAYFTPVGFYSLAKLAWARFRAVHFDAVEFVPGSATLTASAEAQLNENVTRMRDNPRARPGICGVATALDARAMFAADIAHNSATREAREQFLRDPPDSIRSSLLKLAKERSANVEDFLLRAGLDAEDFIQCAEDYIGSDFDEPRVEISN